MEFGTQTKRLCRMSNNEFDTGSILFLAIITTIIAILVLICEFL